MSEMIKQISILVRARNISNPIKKKDINQPNSNSPANIGNRATSKGPMRILPKFLRKMFSKNKPSKFSDSNQNIPLNKENFSPFSASDIPIPIPNHVLSFSPIQQAKPVAAATAQINVDPDKEKLTKSAITQIQNFYNTNLVNFKTKKWSEENKYGFSHKEWFIEREDGKSLNYVKLHKIDGNTVITVQDSIGYASRGSTGKSFILTIDNKGNITNFRINTTTNPSYLNKDQVENLQGLDSFISDLNTHFAALNVPSSASISNQAQKTESGVVEATQQTVTIQNNIHILTENSLPPENESFLAPLTKKENFPDVVTDPKERLDFRKILTGFSDYLLELSLPPDLKEPEKEKILKEMKEKKKSGNPNELGEIERSMHWLEYTCLNGYEVPDYLKNIDNMPVDTEEQIKEKINLENKLIENTKTYKTISNFLREIILNCKDTNSLISKTMFADVLTAFGGCQAHQRTEIAKIHNKMRNEEYDPINSFSGKWGGKLSSLKEEVLKKVIEELHSNVFLKEADGYQQYTHTRAGYLDVLGEELNLGDKNEIAAAKLDKDRRKFDNESDKEKLNEFRKKFNTQWMKGLTELVREMARSMNKSIGKEENPVKNDTNDHVPTPILNWINKLNESNPSTANKIYSHSLYDEDEETDYIGILINKDKDLSDLQENQGSAYYGATAVVEMLVAMGKIDAVKEKDKILQSLKTTPAAPPKPEPTPAPAKPVAAAPVQQIPSTQPVKPMTTATVQQTSAPKTQKAPQPVLKSTKERITELFTEFKNEFDNNSVKWEQINDENGSGKRYIIGSGKETISITIRKQVDGETITLQDYDAWFNANTNPNLGRCFSIKLPDGGFRINRKNSQNPSQDDLNKLSYLINEFKTYHSLHKLQFSHKLCKAVSEDKTGQSDWSDSTVAARLLIQTWNGDGSAIQKDLSFELENKIKGKPDLTEKVREILLQKLQNNAQRTSNNSHGKDPKADNIKEKYNRLITQTINANEIGKEKDLTEKEVMEIRKFRVKKLLAGYAGLNSNEVRGARIPDSGVRFKQLQTQFIKNLDNEEQVQASKDWLNFTKFIKGPLSELQSDGICPELYLLRYLWNDGKLEPSNGNLKKLVSQFEALKSKYPFQVDGRPDGSGFTEMVITHLENSMYKSASAQNYRYELPHEVNAPKEMVDGQGLYNIKREKMAAYLNIEGVIKEELY